MFLCCTINQLINDYLSAERGVHTVNLELDWAYILFEFKFNSNCWRGQIKLDTESEER